MRNNEIHRQCSHIPSDAINYEYQPSVADIAETCRALSTIPRFRPTPRSHQQTNSLSFPIQSHYNLQPFTLLYGRPSIPSTRKTGKETFNRWLFEYIANDGCIFEGLCGNGKELTKQIDQPIELTHHANDGPSHHYQKDSTKETHNSS